MSKRGKQRTEKKKKGTLVFDIIIVVLLCVIAFSLFKVITILDQYSQGTQVYNEIAENTDTTGDSLDVDWDALRKKNQDVVAWLYSEGTVINYPVVQGEDNSYYLHRLLNGEYNFKGTLFVDYRVENPFEDFNTIIYGHRMKDGSMFHSLINYREQDYYEAHKVMELATPDHQYEIEVFAAVTIPADSDMYECVFNTEGEKEEYLTEIQKESVLNTDVTVTSEDRIVMMSTCTYEFDNARVVVYGKLVEKD